MRDLLKKPGLNFLLAGTAALFFAGCEVDVKDPGSPPGVDVDVQPGESPDVDATGPEIDVQSGEGTGPGVNVDIGKEDGGAGAPDISVDVPERNDN